MLDPKCLDTIYQKWYYGDRLAETHWPKTYKTGKYRDQQFEDWLWVQGFTVVQKDKKRYLKFSGNERELTIFLLRWS